MTFSDETELRRWLVDYLVTNSGCSPDDLDFDAPLNDLGVTSRDAVVLSGELSELLDRPVSPVEFWQHPTINALTGFLTGAEPDPNAETVRDADHRSPEESIAVIGLGCRFPGNIDGPESLWQFLFEGGSAVTEVPPDRWPPFDDGSPEVAAALSHTTRWGAFLTDIDAFDADFFEISPREADKMDPQQRLLLEVTHEALEHAGIPIHSLRQTQTGVFAGACAGEYGYLAATDLSQVDAWSGTGGALSIIANRVSYFFDLHGPSVTVDTACSSSLVAVHLACESLRAGGSNLAIAAGVNLLLSPAVTRSFDQADAMSPTGQCHAFDADADGFVRGEGCGAVILKRLSDARRDGDRVLAVVRGTAVNQDGRSNGLMAPNPAAQMAVLRAAYANAGIEPRDVDYVEAHGTGTLLGDPIEARALGRVLGRGRPQGAALLVGAVKSNLGHLEAAAGIAGFIKAVLSVQRGRIPANPNFRKPNPHIPFDKLRLKVVAEPTDWPTTGHPRRAGVSSFGFGGTNAHVVLEQGAERSVASSGPETSQPADAVTTLVVSGKTDGRVASTAAMLAQWMDGDGADVGLPEVAHALNHHRSQYPKFGTVAACDRAQAVAGLRALAAGQSAPGVIPPHQGGCRPGTVFVYSGQGSQWAGMGRQLLEDEPAFSAAISELEPAFVEQAGLSLRQVLESGEPVVGIDRIQPVLVGMQLALTELWRHYGVRPDAVIGHSMGEVTAAVVAGALSPAEGLRVIATRSRLMARLSGRGAMALLEADPESVEELIESQPDVTLAVYASPRQSVIAGPPDQVDALISKVAAEDRLARRIEVDVASHNPIIDPVLPDLRAALADLAPRRPTIPVISTTRDDAANGTMVFDADYWCANLRNPVRFRHAVDAAGAQHGTFVEVSPHPVLTYSISETLADVHHHSVSTLQRDTGDTLTFHTNLNATHTVEPPDTHHPRGPHPVIPTTPWHHTRHWMALRERRDLTGAAPKYGTLLGAQIALATPQPMRVWQARLTPEARPYPGCHRIDGVDVVPASVLLQTLSAAAAECGVPAAVEVRFEHPIIVDRPRVIQVVADDDFVTVYSRPATDTPPYRWVNHISGRLSRASSDSAAADDGARGAIDQRHPITADDETRPAAELLRDFGVDGQPFPWSIEAFRPTANGAIAEVRLTEPSTVALLDAAVHAARLVEGDNPRLMMLAGVESIRLTGDHTDPRCSVELRRAKGNADELAVDIAATTSDGSACIDIRSLRYVDVDSGSADILSGDTDPRSIPHVIEWRPWQQGHEGTTAPGKQRSTLAVVGGPAQSCTALQDQLAETGYTPAELADAHNVIYLADAGVENVDVDAAVRLSTEVADLVRMLAERADHHPATLWIITRGVHRADCDAARPQSCLWGLGAVIAAEQPDLWGGVIDLPSHGDVTGYAPALATVLASASETASTKAAESMLVLEDGRFLAPTLVPLSGETVREPLRCRPDAAYLITGGLGSLGLLMADWLANRGARRLVLTGRTPLPPRRDWDGNADPAVRQKIAAIQALEMRGVTVDAVAVDVGSAEAVQALVARRDRDGAPAIRGVIHAAGVTESRLLSDTTDAVLRRVMWPKVAGGQTLQAAFPPGDLDFFFLTASAGTIFGIPGQGAYAAANAYLDCLARARHRHGCHTVSMDWVAWRGLGFAADATVVTQELERLGSRPITSDEAFAAWEYADSYDLPQLVMAPLTSAQCNGDQPPEPVRAWSSMSADELLSELEDGLRTILARELRLPDAEVDGDRPFAELGLNSVMAMSIRRQAERLVGIELSATMLWNHPTIVSLAEYLAKKLSPQEDSDVDSDASPDSKNSVLDTLFDDVDSASTASSANRI